jgi:hypothetical protein
VYKPKEEFAYYKPSTKSFYSQLKNVKMKKNSKLITTLLSVIMIGFSISSFTKSTLESSPSSGLKHAVTSSAVTNAPTPANPDFNLEVILRGEGKSFGLVKFRQDNDAAKIIDLGVWVRDLEPNHAYLLQRAVNTPATGNCSSTGWLTLGLGLTPQAIMTDDKGTGREDLWRDVSAVATGTTFDIHFQIIDANTSAVVLTSDCYQYTVR